MDSEFRSWWIGKNGAQQWSKALDDEGGALGAIEMIFKAGAATQQARIEALIVALEIIAGKRQCTDNTMSNVEIALAALLDSEPSAHTCNASCQLPACVLRRRVEGAVVTPPILRIEK